MAVETPIEYTISTATADGAADSETLQAALAAVTFSGGAPAYTHIVIRESDDKVFVFFEDDSDLPDVDKTTLDAALAAHYGDLTSSQRLLDYQIQHEIMVDDTIGATFWDVLTLPNISMRAQMYILLAHLFKGMEAQDIINDRDGTDLRPRAYRRNGGAKKHAIVKQEATKRGITEEQIADLINPWSDFQQDFIAGLEEVRAPAKDGIRAAADHAAVDAAFAQFQVDLGTFLASLTPPS
jgi:hypothetical protein